MRFGGILRSETALGSAINAPMQEVDVAQHQWEDSVRRRLGAGNALVFNHTRVAVVLRVPCCRGHMVEVECRPHRPVEHVVQKMLNEGWTIGRKLTCPKHARKRRSPVEEPSFMGGPTPHDAPEIKIEPVPPGPYVEPTERGEENMATTEKAAPSDAAKAKRREAWRWLDESFDIDKGVFKGGMSDAKIATETGLSEAAVITLREEQFGPLKMPSEVGEIRAALAAARVEIEASKEAALQAVAAQERRLDALCRKNGW